MFIVNITNTQLFVHVFVMFVSIEKIPSTTCIQAAVLGRLLKASTHNCLTSLKGS